MLVGEGSGAWPAGVQAGLEERVLAQVPSLRCSCAIAPGPA